MAVVDGRVTYLPTYCTYCYIVHLMCGSGLPDVLEGLFFDPPIHPSRLGFIVLLGLPGQAGRKSSIQPSLFGYGPTAGVVPLAPIGRQDAPYLL